MSFNVVVVKYFSATMSGAPRKRKVLSLELKAKMIKEVASGEKKKKVADREKGGAYGVGAVVRPGGCLSFYSYRDPNMEKTLDAFADSLAWLTRGEFTGGDLEEAKLACFAKVDRPITPGDRGASTFLHGVTDEMRQEHRQRILRSTKDDVIAAVKRCAGDSGCTSSIAVIGPENMFTETGKHWLVHRE